MSHKRLLTASLINIRKCPFPGWVLISEAHAVRGTVAQGGVRPSGPKDANWEPHL